MLYLVAPFVFLAATWCFATKMALVDELRRRTIILDLFDLPDSFRLVVHFIGSSLSVSGLPADLPVELDEPRSFVFRGLGDQLSLSVSSVSIVLGLMDTRMYAASSSVIGF
jgi:hypothetical protein